MKKLVSDYTAKKVIVLCSVVMLLGSVFGYLVGWALGSYYGKELGKAEVIENAILSHDDQYHYMEYDGNIHFYE